MSSSFIAVATKLAALALASRRDPAAARRSGIVRADVALAAYELSFTHPGTGEVMTFRHNPSGGIFRSFGLPPQA